MNLTGVSSVVAGLVPLIVAFVGIYAARKASVGRNHAKRLAIIDLTQKRLELRDQLLKLEIAAAKGAADEREAKRQAQLAVQKIVSDADLLIKQLEWRTQLDLAMRHKLPTIPLVPLTGTRRFSYSLYMIAATILGIALVVAAAGYTWIESKHISDRFDFEVFVVAIVLMPTLAFLGADLRRKAYSIKYPKPEGPILDEL
jgi:hypothetical protein